MIKNIEGISWWCRISHNDVTLNHLTVSLPQHRLTTSTNTETCIRSLTLACSHPPSKCWHNTSLVPSPVVTHIYTTTTTTTHEIGATNLLWCLPVLACGRLNSPAVVCTAACGHTVIWPPSRLTTQPPKQPPMTTTPHLRIHAHQFRYCTTDAVPTCSVNSLDAASCWQAIFSDILCIFYFS
jgi:hypothetical protein